MKSFFVDGREIGEAVRTFIIAEAGINHEGDAGVAERMIVEAAATGADAIKFQTYRAERRVDRNSPIFGVLRRCELSGSVHRRLAKIARDEGIIFFSTPFDHEAVDLLESLQVSLFKIASFDLVNLALIARVVEARKPVLLSRGMADCREIDAALDLVASAGVPAALLHCVSSYPTPTSEANLRAIHRLRERYAVPIGYSDHTLGLDVAVASIAAGAVILEKHFTLDRERPGADHALSLDPPLLAALVTEVREMEAILGTGEIGCRAVEREILRYRRIS